MENDSLKSFDEKKFKELVDLIKGETKNFIFQQNTFSCRLVEKNDLRVVVYERDSLDNLDDEYICVEIFRRITLILSVIVRVYDSDGDFIVIDSVDCALSKDFHSFIFKGSIFYGKFNSKEGLNGTCFESHSLSQTIDEYCKERIKGLNDIYHDSCVYIPRELAHLLQQLPHAISNIIEFLENEQTQIIECYAHDLITTRVKFTKALFTHLYSFSCVPPRKSKWNHVIDKPKNMAFYNGYKLTLAYKRMLLDLESRMDETDSSGVFDLNREILEIVHAYKNTSETIEESEYFEDDLNWLFKVLNEAENLVKNKFENPLDKDFVQSQLNSFIAHKPDFNGVDFSNSDIHKPLEIDPSSIESKLNDMLNEFKDFELSESDEEMFELMENIGQHLHNVTDAIPKEEDIVDNLINSSIQDPVTGPASHLLSQIGFNPTSNRD